jgi:hypothetical protein
VYIQIDRKPVLSTPNASQKLDTIRALKMERKKKQTKNSVYLQIFKRSPANLWHFCVRQAKKQVKPVAENTPEQTEKCQKWTEGNFPQADVL